MATLASPSPPSSPSLSRRRRGFIRRCERCCCNIVTYFPLAFVYGLTTWAAWVQYQIGRQSLKSWPSNFSALVGLILYALLNWSYTTAVFTDPGSPLGPRFSQLPTQEPRAYTSFTVKSTGDIRFCKKCQTKKPDRAHHCSTCRRCVLKMDHHCPWLAACIGLKNYKPFLLFLFWLSLFCWLCFSASGTWLWSEIVSEAQFEESLMPVNYILLAVISGIIGLVLTGFTAWHIMLAAKGQTTIESLEKIRYLSPLRRSMQQQLLPQRQYVDQEGRMSFGDQLREIHANIAPGVTRPEEGEERSSPAQNSLRRTWSEMEQQRERDRYNDYLDEQDTEKLPNAFDLGWKRNLMHVLGENQWLWLFPICNTTGDGWQWEANPKWIAAREQIRREREAQIEAQKARERAAGWGIESPRSSTPSRSATVMARPEWDADMTRDTDSRWLMTNNGLAAVPSKGRRSPNKADQILGRIPGMYADQPVGAEGRDSTPLQDMSSSREVSDDYSSSTDDEENLTERRAFLRNRPQQTENWNDLPSDMTSGPRRGASGSRGRGARGRGAASQRVARDEWQDWGPS